MPDEADDETARGCGDCAMPFHGGRILMKITIDFRQRARQLADPFGIVFRHHYALIERIRWINASDTAIPSRALISRIR